jgi:hypothetical protein
MPDSGSGSLERQDQKALVPIYCQQCGRANGASAKNCIWCGLPIKQGFMQRFDTTRVEIEYLSGIDGLDDPTTVRLVITGGGLEVSELHAGHKAVRISAHSLIDARVVDASVTVDGGRGRAPWWWWLVLGPFALVVPGKKRPDIKRSGTTRRMSCAAPCSTARISSAARW